MLYVLSGPECAAVCVRLCVQQIMAHMAYAQYLSALSSVIKMHTTHSHTAITTAAWPRGDPVGATE